MTDTNLKITVFSIKILIFIITALICYILFFGGITFQFKLSITHLKSPFLFLLLFASLLYYFDNGFRIKVKDAACVGNMLVQKNTVFWIMVLLYFLLFFVFKMTQYFSFRPGSYELAMYEGALHNTLNGNFMYTPFIGRNYFSEHFSPFLLLLIPLYKIFSTPIFLIFVETIFMTFAAVPLYYFMNDIKGDKYLSLLLCFLYLNSSYLFRGFSYDFHQEMIWPFFLFSCFYFLHKKRVIPYFLCLVLALSIKEDIGIYMFFTGIYFAFVKKERKIGFTTSFVSLCWSLIAFKLIIPSCYAPYSKDVVVASRFMEERYAQLGSTYVELLFNLITHPQKILNAIFHRSFNDVLSKLIWLPIVDPIFLLAIPPLMINTLSSYRAQYDLLVYYSVTMLPYLYIATGHALAKIEKRTRARAIVYVLAIILIHKNLPRIDFNFPEERDYFGINLMKNLPENSSYSAHEALVNYIPKSNEMFIFPGNYKYVEYILLDSHRPYPSPGKEKYDEALNDIRNSGKFLLVYDKNGFLLFKKS